MQTDDEQKRRKELRELLEEMGSTQGMLKDSQIRRKYYHRLENIYYNADGDNFRHYYSDIFAALNSVDNQGEGLDVLSENMRCIRDKYQPKNVDKNNKTINIRKEIDKLYDHINLDIARMTYTKSFARKAKSELEEASTTLEELKIRLEESDRERKQAYNSVESDVARLKEEINDSQVKMQNEYITILGIFAAIVLAFTGGMVFSSSVLENISKSPIYMTVIMACIIGLVFFNLVWALLDFILMVNDSMSKYPSKYIWIVFNIIMICGVAVACILHECGLAGF